MKNNLELILVGIAIAFSGFRLYQKYIKKDPGKSGDEKKSGSSFASNSKDDDYEPYQKR